jgi:hypothetical protein
VTFSANFQRVFLLVAVGLIACVDLSAPGKPAVSSGSGGGGRRDGGFDARGGAGGAASEAGAPDPEVAPAVDVEPGSGETSAPVNDTGPAPHEVTPALDAPMDSGPPASLANGTSCTAGASCTSGKCVDGVCCDTACTEACRACNGPASRGTCSPEPAQTVCAPGTCSNASARGASVCDGAGTCMAGAASLCGAYACSGVSCASACVTSAECVPPYTCSGNACVSPGLLLRWAFDEDGGITAIDSSGYGRDGLMIGNGFSRPQASSSVAPLAFPNPHSRRFVAVQDEGVVYTPIPAVLKGGAPQLTLAAWLRANAVEPGGSDIVGVGIDVILRLRDDGVQMLRRKSNQPGGIYAVAEKLTTTHLDGRWHHLAGTSGPTGTKLYLDGKLVDWDLTPDPTVNGGSDQIGVGHQPGNDLHEHDGEIDDVRIYGRVLSDGEIANLASGHR